MCYIVVYGSLSKAILAKLMKNMTECCRFYARDGWEYYAILMFLYYILLLFLHHLQKSICHLLRIHHHRKIQNKSTTWTIRTIPHQYLVEFDYLRFHAFSFSSVHQQRFSQFVCTIYEPKKRFKETKKRSVNYSMMASITK